MDNDAMLQELKRSWDEVELCEDNHKHWLILSGGAHRFMGPAGNLWFNSPEECLAAGVAFTKKRKKEIRKIERGIKFIREERDCALVVIGDDEQSAFFRGVSARAAATLSGILAREQAALAELQRGMRVEG